LLSFPAPQPCWFFSVWSFFANRLAPFCAFSFLASAIVLS
jgi:hypothetical protein